MISIQMVTMIWIIQFRVHFPRISISQFRFNIYQEIIHNNISPYFFFFHNIKWFNWFRSKKRKNHQYQYFYDKENTRQMYVNWKEKMSSIVIWLYLKKIIFKIHVRIDAHLFFVCNRNNIYIFFTKKVQSKSNDWEKLKYINTTFI